MINIWKRSKWQQINWMHICRTSNPIPGIASQIFVFESSITTNFNIEILIDVDKFSLTLTKVKKIQSNQSPNTAKNSDQRRAVFVIISKVGLQSLNLIFSGSNGPSVKISVSIRKRIAWGLQNSPYFWQ